MITLKPLPLTSERFAPYGDVVGASKEQTDAMNADRFERFDDLCGIDIAEGGHVSVSIARCRVATSLPYRIDMVDDALAYSLDRAEPVED